MFDELVTELTSRIEGTESKARSRNDLTQKHFNLIRNDHEGV